VGVTIGASAAFWLTRFLKSVLFGVSPFDPATYVGTVALLFGLTLLASWWPARRATRVDPASALRYE
jgi:ABC-type antimicrobial peptide transport system permease subunit